MKDLYACLSFSIKRIFACIVSHRDAPPSLLAFTSLWCICVLFSSYFHNISAHDVYRIRFQQVHRGSLPALPESQLFYRVVNRSYVALPDASSSTLIKIIIFIASGEKLCSICIKKFSYQYIFLYKFKTHDLGAHSKISPFAAIICHNSGKKNYIFLNMSYFLMKLRSF